MLRVKERELAGFPFPLLVGLGLDRWRRIHVLLLRSSGYPFWMLRPISASWIRAASLRRLCLLTTVGFAGVEPSESHCRILENYRFRSPSTLLHLQFQKSLRPPSFLTLTASSEVPKTVLRFNNSLEGPTDLRDALILIARVYYSERMQIKSAEVRLA